MDNFLAISSRENPLVKLVISLQKSAKTRQENGSFVLEGLRICEDAYDNNIEFDTLIVSETALKKYPSEIEKFRKRAKSRISVTDKLFEKMSDTVAPQGIIVIGKIPDRQAVPNPKGRYIALENIADPSNLGAVARTAEALGVTGIIVTDNGCDPYSPKVLRASMGTILRLPIFICDDICAMANDMNMRTIGCVVDSDAADISKIDFSDGDILVIGNEANGLCDRTKHKADILATIRMKGKAESLNAAAAAAIAMWEMVK